MRRAVAAARDSQPAVADETHGDRRKAVKELSRLGWLYGPLNQMAPLARLLAMVTFVRHSSAHAHLLPVMASVAASLTLRPFSLLAKRLLPPTETLSGGGAEDLPLAPNDEGGSVSTATLRTRLLVTHLMQLAAYSALLGVGVVDLAACGLDPVLPGREQAGLLGAATAAVAPHGAAAAVAPADAVSSPGGICTARPRRATRASIAKGRGSTAIYSASAS